MAGLLSFCFSLFFLRFGIKNRMGPGFENTRRASWWMEEKRTKEGTREARFFLSARRFSSARLGSQSRCSRRLRVNLSKFVPIRFMSATPRDATRYHAYTMPLPIVLPRILVPPCSRFVDDSSRDLPRTRKNSFISLSLVRKVVRKRRRSFSCFSLFSSSFFFSLRYPLPVTAPPRNCSFPAGNCLTIRAR